MVLHLLKTHEIRNLNVAHELHPTNHGGNVTRKNHRNISKSIHYMDANFYDTIQKCILKVNYN